MRKIFKTHTHEKNCKKITLAVQIENTFLFEKRPTFNIIVKRL